MYIIFYLAVNTVASTCLVCGSIGLFLGANLNSLHASTPVISVLIGTAVEGIILGTVLGVFGAVWTAAYSDQIRCFQENSFWWPVGNTVPGLLIGLLYTVDGVIRLVL